MQLKKIYAKVERVVHEKLKFLNSVFELILRWRFFCRVGSSALFLTTYVEEWSLLLISNSPISEFHAARLLRCLWNEIFC
jgi:hypothetical protein